MKVDILVAEIGSTTTVVNGFDGVFGSCPLFVGQGQAATSVLAGDVTIGLMEAIEDLKKKLGSDTLEYDEFYATSSAAGGLKMTVHGLVYDMTVKAAKEAALGAGANLHYVTAGKLRSTDLDKIKRINPNIILIAGGVDYGERDTALDHAEKIASLGLKVPVIYAGNVENQEEIKAIFERVNVQVYIVDNVYPKIDQLNVLPTRHKIQEVFESHITKAPGMEKVRQYVTQAIMPTPGAVMEATKLLKETIGDIMTLDVGGATTDVHSVTLGSDEINRILLSPEPEAKRTVEGDLGVYLNQQNICDLIGQERLEKELNLTREDLDRLQKEYRHIPKNDDEKAYVECLTREAVKTALLRHCGRTRALYGPSGKKMIAEGKDLTAVKNIVGTGGALTRLDAGANILAKVSTLGKGERLLPRDVNVFIDHHYIMASLGVLSTQYPKVATKLLLKSFASFRGRGGVVNESKS